MPSLRERAERAFKPGAPQGDVDILVAALAPEAPREVSTPELAQLLHRILSDPHLSARQDREGRPVRHIAAEALQALGPPYATQLPVNALPQRQLSPEFDRRVLIGLLLLAVVAVVELLALIGAAVLPYAGYQGLLAWNPSISDSPPPPPPTLSSEWRHIISPGLLCLVPSLLSLWAWRSRKGELLQVATVLLWSCAGMRLLLFAIAPGGALFRACGVFLFTGAVMALAGFCFRPLWEPYRRKFSRAG